MTQGEWSKEKAVVDDDRGVDRLVHDLFDPDRHDPLVVVSVSRKAKEPYLDVDWLNQEIEGTAHTVVLSATASARLTDRLGDDLLAVFGGSSRIFPAGKTWVGEPRSAPLYFCYPGQGRAVADKIIAYVRLLSYRRGVSVAPELVAGDVPTTAEVFGCPTDSQIFVHTREGRTCKMLAAHLYPGVEATRLVRTGQRFSGRERIGNVIGDFFPESIDDDPLARARKTLPDGTATFAQVDRVTRTDARLLLHPKVEAALLPRDENLTHLLSPGDVVAVEVIWDDSGFLVDLVRAEDAGPAMSILPGGPPWISPARPEDESHGGTTEEGLPGEGRELGLVQLDADEAAATVVLLNERVQELEAELRELRTENREVKKERREALASSRPKVHSDEEEQFRFEVQLSYLTRVPPVDRAEHPLPAEYLLGPEFLETQAKLVGAGGIGRDKIVDVCADVLSGRAATMVSRAPKPWTVSAQGPQQTRADGALAWRIRLQTATAGARRMKYWVRPDRIVEFESVGVHDDGI